MVTLVSMGIFLFKTSDKYIFFSINLKNQLIMIYYLKQEAQWALCSP